MKLSDFDFSFDESQVALTPLSERTASKLMVYDASSENTEISSIRNLGQFFNERSVFVFNRSPVIPVRFLAHKITGGEIEGLFIRSLNETSQEVWIQGRVKAGDELVLKEGPSVKIKSRNDREAVLEISTEVLKKYLSEKALPGLPPYIRKMRRKNWGNEEWQSDRERYQSVMANAASSGFSLAAPTASLHFDEDLISSLKSSGHEVVDLELDVGLGTFAPLEHEEIALNRLHWERIRMDPRIFDQLLQRKQEGKKIVAVGTTALRALESAYLQRESGLDVSDFETDLFIYPGKDFDFKIVDSLLTNFHQPRSSLLLLIASFLEPRVFPIQHTWRKIYEKAVNEKFRLFSYGDALLILPRGR